MNKNILYLLAVIIVIIAAVGFFLFYNNQPNESLQELEKTTIKEYEGKDLSSINDFRENSIKGPQYVDRNDYKLKISGLEGDNLELTYDEVLANKDFYKKVVTLDCVEGWSVDILWEGFLIKDLIDRDQIPEDKNTIILKAYDGYSTSFPIDYVFENDIIIAYKMNDIELPPERGFPFQLVAESKWGYKWIKWITEIEFSDDADHEGYWESRGYSNTGNLNESFFGN